ncbi:MAG: hypothetical protein KatS3mg057_3144 [Herpetosiphonaceae bacterium]|nr:MAG: hypothetical protein KatS3mg057_3144 [Herpetosiphonaceae bacterium]
MIPTLRLLLLTLVGGLPVAAASAVPSLWPAPLLYLLAVATLVVIDWRITPKPKSLEVARINEAKLSIGVPNRIAVAVHNSSSRPLQLEVRDEFPIDFPSDTLIMRAALDPGATEELVYHVRPLRRGDYRFGDINIRYLSALGTFKRQMRVPFDELVKVYPNVLDIRKYDLLARRGMLVELGLRTTKIFGAGTEFERLRDYTPDDEFRRIQLESDSTARQAYFY